MYEWFKHLLCDELAEKDGCRQYSRFQECKASTAFVITASIIPYFCMHVGFFLNLCTFSAGSKRESEHDADAKRKSGSNQQFRIPHISGPVSVEERVLFRLFRHERLGLRAYWRGYMVGCVAPLWRYACGGYRMMEWVVSVPKFVLVS